MGHGASVNETNADGETPLHIACRHGFVEFLHLLSKNKVKISQKPNSIFFFFKANKFCKNEILGFKCIIERKS